jgi:hypothetical protein
MMPSNEGMRIIPELPAHAFKTYQIVSPADTFVKAACAQVGCVGWRNGWESHIDEATDLGRSQAHYIRGGSARTFTETRRADGVTVFRFEAGQRCFADHQTRPEHFLVRDGDWRGNPYGTQPFVHSSPDDWVEDFALHQQGVSDRIERG